MKTKKIPDTMTAVVYRGANDLRVETLPVPTIGNEELLVKVAVCGVCPTDIKKIQMGSLSPPRVFGHETAGTIVAAGSGVRGWSIGDRVALHHHVPCLQCRFCRHRNFAQCTQYKRTGVTAGFEPAGGGYAEYVRVLDFALPGVVKIPEGNSFAEGAMLEPVNTVLKGIRRLELLAGDEVVIFGQGPIGLMFTAVLAQSGITVTAADLHESRLERALEFGASSTLLVRPRLSELAERETGGPADFDAAILATPSPSAVRQALESVRGGGKVLLFAQTAPGNELGLDLSRICVEEKDLLGSYSSDFTLQEVAAGWVFSGKLRISRLITHQYPLRETGAAVARAAEAAGDTLKIVVTI